MSSNGHHNFVPTDDQRRAIEHVHGPMLVVAGAGTGKTTVLAHRIAHLIQTEAARPDEILAVTYTRNSAAELIRRVAAILYPNLDQQPSLYPELNRSKAAKKLLSDGLQAHTFHGYCYKLLHDAGAKFALLDDKDLFILLRRRIGEMKLEHYIKAATPGKFLEDLLKFFSSCHDELRTPADYDNYVARLERHEIPLPRMEKSRRAQDMSEAEVLGRCHEVARAFRFAEELLHQEGLGTFGHIMTRAVDVLMRRKSVLERQQRRARFILIDEFQDSNVAQIKLASLLAGEQANVFAVGDPDQAIYQFRGATSDAFDHFLQTFGPERVQRVTMSANRRSTPPILRCAYQLIQCNPTIASVEGGWSRQPLTCARADRDPLLANATAVHAIVHSGPEQEAGFVADTIQAMQRDQPGIAAEQHRCAVSRPLLPRADRRRAHAPRHTGARQGRRSFRHARSCAMPWRCCAFWIRRIPSHSFVWLRCRSSMSIPSAFATSSRWRARTSPPRLCWKMFPAERRWWRQFAQRGRNFLSPTTHWRLL